MTVTNWIKASPHEQIYPQPRSALQNSGEQNTDLKGLENLAAGFEPITLKQMDAVALLNRTDTKFVMPVLELLTVLSQIQSQYRILSVNGMRLNHYRTLYFDTADFELYRLHNNGRADRYKVRSREYTDTQLSFLEVKHKTRKDRTIKERILTPQPLLQMTNEAVAWLHGVYPFDSRTLEPRLWNSFTRLTLVNRLYPERVTLDVAMTFYTLEQTVHLDGVAIAEVKMDHYQRSSPFLAQMHAHKIHPRGFSKYCMGVSLLYSEVKKNSMKPKLLFIEKLIGGNGLYD